MSWSAIRPSLFHRPLAVLCALLACLALLAPAAFGAEPPAESLSACQAQTPADGPVGCLEVFPLGSSARVTFDNTDLGLSPMAIPGVLPGTHTVRLDRLGSVPWVTTVEIGEGESKRIDPPLAALPNVAEPLGDPNPYPLAVMVENAPDARPQTGLDKADIVYEALAEGGISRFMVLYFMHDADVIGPVRSTRHYFVYTAAEYNATLVHIGASPIGYAALSATGIRHLNESAGDPGVWRSTSRYAPHNAYTSTMDARAAADGINPGGPGSWGPLVFKDVSTPISAQAASSIRVDYNFSYGVRYEYDPETNYYLRWMDGERHRDGATGEQLRARNVIVQVVPDEVIDREGRLDLSQTGEGQAYYFVDGTVVQGTWTKADFGSQTFFWDTAGNLVRVNPVGTTWIQIVPSARTLSFE